MIRQLCLACLGTTVLLGSIISAWSADGPARHPDAETLGDLARNPEFETQGEYEADFEGKKLGAQVIAYGDGKYDVVMLKEGLPRAGVKNESKLTIKAVTKEGKVHVGSKLIISNGELKGAEEGATTPVYKKVYRVSPTMGAKPPEGALVLFNGSNLDQWNNAKLEDGHLLGVGCRTKAKFRDFTLHLEFRTPFMPTKTGQARGNSGMYLLDQYECQILDSFGLTGENNECGGFYTIQKPNVNMCLPPMSWQTYDVDFTAAKFDAAGKKTADAIVTIKHNGELIHDKFALPRNTPGGGLTDESQPGALYLQNHGDAVRFRNIWILEKK